MSNPNVNPIRRYHTSQPLVDYDRLLEVGNEWLDSFEHTESNAKFISCLEQACVENLKASIMPNIQDYIEAVLNDLWDSQKGTYIDSGGTERYYEIPSCHTKSGHPVVVSYR